MAIRAPDGANNDNDNDDSSNSLSQVHRDRVYMRTVLLSTKIELEGN